MAIPESGTGDQHLSPGLTREPATTHPHIAADTHTPAEAPRATCPAAEVQVEAVTSAAAAEEEAEVMSVAAVERRQVAEATTRAVRHCLNPSQSI
jgi:hypothetical protein